MVALHKQRGADGDVFKKMRKSPIYFVRIVWKLSPQPVRPEFAPLVKKFIKDGEFEKIKPHYFEKFSKGKHITWQQWLILLAVERSANPTTSGGKKKRVSVASGHGIGKCLAVDTEVLMYDGSIRKVQDVVVGDKLMGDDNNPRNVLSVTDGEEMMYRVKYFDGSYYDVNESHVLSLVASQTHGTQKSGDKTDISVSDYLKKSDRWKRTNIGYKTSVEFPEKKLNIDPYLLGLWLGDGESRGSRIYNVDKEILDYLGKLNIVSDSISKNGCHGILIEGLNTKLRKEGLRNNKHIPGIYLRSSKKQRLELLAGLLDTDGSLEKTKRQFSITQKNERLAGQIKWIAQSVGCHATLNKVKKYCYYKGKKREGDYYIVNISRNTEIIPTKIARKKALKIKNPQRNNLHYGFTIEPLKIDKYYGFEVDGNSRFLLGDFTVTHNSCSMAWVLLWFLFCHKDAQVSCTANTAPQIYDVLWKEASKWITKMPEAIKSKYEWQSTYIRMHDYKDSEKVWFARARTASKENPEALAGMHGDNQLVLVDEASGVPDAIFDTMEGALTDKRPLVVMISNPTRTLGYFYDSHHRYSSSWYNMQFSSNDSPVVSQEYVEKIMEKSGSDGDEYRIRVLGQFPREDAVDDKGYVPLFVREDFKQAEEVKMVGKVRLGVDPAGEGSNKTAWVIRDDFKAKVVALESVSSIKKIAQKTLMIMDMYGIEEKDVTVDNFGIGANVAQQIALSGVKVNAINVGDKPNDKERYQNLKAELFFTLKEWIRNGGEIAGSLSEWEREFLNIKYTRSLGEAKIKIKPKKEMVKEGIPSPDRMDALMMSFYGESRKSSRVFFPRKQVVSNVSYKRKYF